VQIIDGWDRAGKTGETIGPDVMFGQLWTPVKWDDEDDPDWHQTEGLRKYKAMTLTLVYLDGNEHEVFGRPEWVRKYPPFIKTNDKIFEFSGFGPTSKKIVYREIKVVPL
jgi:hypothetical protein